MIGPANAVSAPTKARACLIGLGKPSTTPIILSTKVITLVAIFKNCSPIVAKSARRDSIALRYLPDADSVTAVNSRPAIDARSELLAFIRSKT